MEREVTNRELYVKARTGNNEATRKYYKELLEKRASIGSSEAKDYVKLLNRTNLD